jgi:hypothetical protein
MLPLGGLHGKHAVQRGIWVPTHHLLWDQGKPRKILIEMSECWGISSRLGHWIFLTYLILPAALWPWVSTPSLTEMSTRNPSVRKGRPIGARGWQSQRHLWAEWPRRLTNLWDSTACYKDRFAFLRRRLTSLWLTLFATRKGILQRWNLDCTRARKLTNLKDGKFICYIMTLYKVLILCGVGCDERMIMTMNWRRLGRKRWRSILKCFPYFVGQTEKNN